jgi:hypothetical protein
VALTGSEMPIMLRQKYEFSSQWYYNISGLWLEVNTMPLQENTAAQRVTKHCRFHLFIEAKAPSRDSVLSFEL